MSSEINVYAGRMAPTVCPSCKTETICHDGGTPWCTECGVVTSFYEERAKREAVQKKQTQTSESEAVTGTGTNKRTEL